METGRIKVFFAERYPEAVNTKSRKREFVMHRRMIVNFLFAEAKLRVSVIKHIIGKKHQVPCYFLRHVSDLTYEKLYREETDRFRDDFFNAFPL